MRTEYFAPSDLEEALDLLASKPLKIVAGGTDYYPVRGREPCSSDILDITRIGALKGVSQGTEAVRIGAAASWTDIVKADLPPAFDGLKAAAREIGSVQVQNAGTVAGNLCNASPAADGVPPLLTLEAEVELSSPDGCRRLPLAEFLIGPRATALGPAELVSAVHVPVPAPHTKGAFEKIGSRKYLVISISMIAVLVGLDNAGRIDFARVAAGACSPVALRLAALEQDLLGQCPDAIEVLEKHLISLSPISDARADPAYRLEAVAEQIRRAIHIVCEAHG